MSIRQEANKLRKYYESLPEWYWKRGIHDAKITMIYEDFEKGRKFLDIHINAAGAIFEQDITKIRLYDHKIISPDNIGVLDGGFWLSDSIETLDSGRYLLKAVISCNDDKDHITLEVRFSDPLVERK
ncbi:MAG: hypothetical protein IKT46_00385 [Clostridia bacterium]|nr:hypothetical protein [Clostridia bacterium]